MKKRKKSSNKYIYPIFILIASLFMGVGYARVNDNYLDINGTGEVSLPKEVLIIDALYASNVGADINNSKVNYFTGTLLDSQMVLGNSNFSTITYNINVYNNTDYDQVFIGVITDLLDSELYSNPDIEFSLTGIEEYQTVLAPKESLTFQITFSYKENVTITNTILTSKLNFRFKEVPKIILSNEGQTETVTEIYPGMSKEIDFKVLNYDDSYINMEPLTYSFAATVDSPFTIEIIDENGSVVENAVSLIGNSTDEEKHNYKAKITWNNTDENFDFSEYEGKSYKGEVILTSIPEDSEKYLDYTITKKFDITINLHWTDQVVPVATIKATKSLSGTEVASARWSDEGLNFTLTAETVGSSGATIYYCQDTTNTCEPNVVATSGTTITTYNNLVQNVYYIRYKIVNGQSISSEIKSYTAKVNNNPLCVLADDSSVSGLNQAAKYNCKVDPDRDAYTFYILTTPGTNDSTVNLIMDSNIRNNGNPIKESSPSDISDLRFEWISKTDFYEIGGSTSDWTNNLRTQYGPITAMDYLAEATSNWSNLTRMTVDSFNVCSSRTSCTETKKMAKTYQVYARLPYVTELVSGNKQAIWVIDYLHGGKDADNGISGRNGVSNLHGYWTLSASSEDTGKAWHMYYLAYTDRQHVWNNGSYGVRPVITVPINRINY